MEKVVITSGFFNPIHIGHLHLIREAKKLGDKLVVIINNDDQVKMKGSAPFMPQHERMEIIKSLRDVDVVFLSVDTDLSVAKSLEAVARRHGGRLVFAKGGDRNADNIPDAEKRICRDLGIAVVSGVGGAKVQSSSWLIQNVMQQ